MKHEDVPGYTELKNKLFQLRFQLQLAKSSEEIIHLKDEIEQVRRKMRKLLCEDLQNKKGRSI